MQTSCACIDGALDLESSVCECQHAEGPRVRRLFTIHGKVNGHDCRILLDCGANTNFMSHEYAVKQGLLLGQKCGRVEMAAVGAVLQQEDETGRHPIAFFSRKLKGAELNWTTSEKEVVAQILAIKKCVVF